jgi:hypothetical protein
MHPVKYYIKAKIKTRYICICIHCFPRTLAVLIEFFLGDYVSSYKNVVSRLVGL